jgi:hypothetical protein
MVTRAGDSGWSVVVHARDVVDNATTPAPGQLVLCMPLLLLPLYPSMSTCVNEGTWGAARMRQLLRHVMRRAHVRGQQARGVRQLRRDSRTTPAAANAVHKHHIDPSGCCQAPMRNGRTELMQTCAWVA